MYISYMGVWGVWVDGIRGYGVYGYKVYDTLRDVVYGVYGVYGCMAYLVCREGCMIYGEYWVYSTYGIRGYGLYWCMVYDSLYGPLRGVWVFPTL